MFILVMRFVIRLAWAHSLKDKRKVKRSLLDSMRKRFNLSIKEVESQEAQQTLVIGISYTALSHSDADRMSRTFTDFIYDNAEGEVSLIEQEIFSFYN